MTSPTAVSYINNQLYPDLFHEDVPLSDASKASLAVFVHIPKSGGTSLRNVMTLNYGRKFRTHHIRLSNLLDTPEQIGDLRALSAHRPFGFHEELLSAHRATVGDDSVPAPLDPVVFSVVRDPVDRAISLYNFVTTFPQHALYQEMKDLEPKQFFRKYRANELDNQQTKFLVGTRLPATFENAVDRIENHFEIVVDSRNQDLLIDHLAQKLGWSVPKERIVANQSPKKLTRETIGASLRDWLEERMSVDRMVFDYVEARTSAASARKN